MADIARDVGVSLSLVSKVLSGRMGRSSVRPGLAAKIRARAKQAGYVTNATARALGKGRQDVVGVFVSRYGQPGSGLVEALIDGVASELARRQQRMLLQFFHTEADFDACLALAHRSVLDGVVVAGAPYFDFLPKLKEILGRKVPVATMVGRPISPEIPNAGIDQLEVGRVATLHLIERNCTRPVFLRLPEPAASLRFMGYRKALKEAGFPYRPELVCSLRTYEPKMVPRLIANLLKSKVPFDGVVAESDLQCSAVLRTLLQAGMRVPKDVKLIGIDDAPVCKFGFIQLSSVSGQDRKRAGLAVRLLNEVIEGHPPRSLALAPLVMARESSEQDGPITPLQLSPSLDPESAPRTGRTVRRTRR